MFFGGNRSVNLEQDMVANCVQFMFMCSASTNMDWRHVLSSVIADSNVHKAYMGPTWGRHDPGEPYVGRMNLAIRGISMVADCVPFMC